MRFLVVGAGVLGTYYAARLHEGGHPVQLLARGARLAELQERGVLLADGDGPVRRVPVPVVAAPDGPYDVALVVVRTQQLVAALESLASLDVDVLTMTNWAAGPQPLEAVLGPGRLVLGFPAAGGVLEDGVVRWAYVTPMALVVARAGSPGRLADEPAAVRALVADLKRQVARLPLVTPRPVGALTRVPDGLFVAGFTRFLRTRTAELGLQAASPSAVAEMELLLQQLGG